MENQITAKDATPVSGIESTPVRQNYELLYIVSGQFSEIELESIKSDVNSMIGKYNGQIGHNESLGKKRLAYPINKVSSGYYILLEFEMENGELLETINRDLKLNHKILRAQILTKNKKTTAEDVAKKNRKKERSISKPIAVAEKPKVEGVAKPADDKRVSMKELDEKLDELLDTDNLL
ncbi:MAG TPA: 30S ribosomal protein S6 [Patescibacteria group bacterium]|nr:30S ribosomal protein S6 [Patescibacteria group bacterium]